MRWNWHRNNSQCRKLTLEKRILWPGIKSMTFPSQVHSFTNWAIPTSLPQCIVHPHLIQRPCYQRGSPCQDPAGNWTTRRPLDHHKETQTAVVYSCLPLIRSSQNHLAWHSERENKARQTQEEVERQHQGMDRPGVLEVPKGGGEQGKMEETGCEIICGAPMTLTVKGQMMMMMMMMMTSPVMDWSLQLRTFKMLAVNPFRFFFSL